MNREPERERTRSPNGSRSRSRDGASRGSWEGTRDRRYETNDSYPYKRNNSKDFASRGGGDNIESWSRRIDYKDGSRYNDYPHRNVRDDYRNTRIPCKYFAAGNCNRDKCKFSHDVHETTGGYDDNRNLGNKNRTWRNDRQPHDVDKYNSVWDDARPSGFDETSHQGHTSHANNNNTTWDSWADKKKSYGHASREASGVHDVGKSHPNLDNKKSSWNGPTTWDDVKSGGFDENLQQGHTTGKNLNNNTWDDPKNSLDGHASQDALGVHDVGKSHSKLDSKKSSWNGPTSRDDVRGSGFPSVSNPCHRYEESAKESLIDSNAKDEMSAKSGSNIDGNKVKKWDGPLWDELSEPVTTDNSESRNWECPGLSKIASDNVETLVNDFNLNNMVPEGAKQVLTSGHDLMSVHGMNTQSVPYQNGSEQSHILLPSPFNGPLNGQAQGMYVHTENQNKGGKALNPLELDVKQSEAMKDVNEIIVASQPAPQANALPAETSHNGQLPQLYKGLHLTTAIDYLKSLPSSAFNQDTRAKEEQNPVRNTIPVEILSGAATQQNQMTTDLTRAGTATMQDEAVEGTDKRVAENSKKVEENLNHDISEAQGKVEEGDIVNDEKAMRQFKVGLAEFVKEILKPKWKEGKMSRDVHKAVVKKVVEKVTSSIQGNHVPRTQPKIEQYLAHSKPKITKLMEVGIWFYLSMRSLVGLFINIYVFVESLVYKPCSVG